MMIVVIINQLQKHLLPTYITNKDYYENKSCYMENF